MIIGTFKKVSTARAWHLAQSFEKNEGIVIS
jgi:hypothetical protein